MKVTLPKVDEIYGENKLDIIKVMGTKAKATDFAIVTGVFVPNLENRFAPYYLKNPCEGYVHAVSYSGIDKHYHATTNRSVGVRPIIEFESIDEILDLGGVIEDDKLKFGAYAYNALLKNEQREWTNVLANKNLKECGKYTLDSTMNDDYDIPYSPIEYSIYEYNGKRSIRIKVNSSYGDELFDEEIFKLSNGELYANGDYVWLEVKDKIWAFDEKKLKAISEEVILGGIQFNEKNNYTKEEDFLNINMGKYLNDVFLPELLQFQNMNLDNLNKEHKDTESNNIHKLILK